MSRAAKRSGGKIAAVVLAVMLILTSIPALTVLAQGDDCIHIHDEDCGYIQEQPCTHVCDESCDPECTHTHDETCGWREETPCGHVHGENCSSVKDIVVNSYIPLEQTAFSVAAGTPQGEIGLPDTLSATLSTDNTSVELALSWVSTPEYDPDVPGNYTMTAVTEVAFAQLLLPPVVTVTVEEPVKVGVLYAVTAFAPLSEEPLGYPLYTSLESILADLPTTLTATVDGATAQVPVTWSCDDYDSEGPGPFTFVAKPAAAYICDPDLTLPVITVVRVAATPVFAAGAIVIRPEQSAAEIESMVQLAIDGAAAGDTVTVMGQKPNLDAPLSFTLPGNVALVWKAHLAAGTGISSLIRLNSNAGSFTFSDCTLNAGSGSVLVGGKTVVVSGSRLSASGSSPLIEQSSTSAHLTVQGDSTLSSTSATIATAGSAYIYSGTVVSDSGHAVHLLGNRSFVQVDGGLVTSAGSGMAAIATDALSALSGPAVRITSGQVRSTATSGGCAILVHGGLSVTGGDISSATGTAVRLVDGTQSVSLTGGVISCQSGITIDAQSGQMLEITGNARVENKGNGPAVSLGIGNHLALSSGTVSNVGGNAAVVTTTGGNQQIFMSGGTISSERTSAVLLKGYSALTMSGGTITGGQTANPLLLDFENSRNDTVLAQGNSTRIVMSGGTIESIHYSAVYFDGVTGTPGFTMSGGQVRNYAFRAAIGATGSVNYRQTGGAVFSCGSVAGGTSDVLGFITPTGGTPTVSAGILVAWSQGQSSYPQGSTQDLTWGPAGEARWDMQNGQNGVRYAYSPSNNPNATNNIVGFIPVNIFFGKTQLTPGDLHYTLPAGAVYSGSNQGIGAVTPPTDFDGILTVYYTGAGDTVYPKSTVPPKNAGTYLVTAETIGGSRYEPCTGNDALPLGSYTIARREITISGITLAPKSYDGSVAAEVEKTAFTNLANGEELTLGVDYAVHATFATADAGVDKQVTVFYALLDTGRATNYKLASTHVITTQTITPAAGRSIDQLMWVSAERSGSYSFDLYQLLPDYLQDPNIIRGFHLSGDPAADSLISGLTLSGRSLTVEVNPAAAGTQGILTISFTANNYSIPDAKLIVRVSENEILTITGISAPDKTYDGRLYSPTGTPQFQDSVGQSITGITPIYTYSADGIVYTTTPPVDAGQYYLQISGTTSSGRTVSPLTISFNINRGSPAILFRAPGNFIYDGSQKVALVSFDLRGTTGYGRITQVTYVGLDSSYQSVIPPVEVGRYNVLVTTEDATNYWNLSSQLVGSFTIAPSTDARVSIRSDRSTVEAGDTLRAVTAPGAAAQSYQWYCDGVPQSGEVYETFIVPASAVGMAVTVEVTTTGNYAGPLVSSPVRVGSTLLSGNATMTNSGTEPGDVLTVHPSVFSVTAAATYDVVWTRDGAPISGASGLTYTLTSADFGKTIAAKLVGNGAFTGEIPAGSIFIPIIPPAIPTIFVVPGDGQITVNWVLPHNGGSAITGNTVQLNSEPPIILSPGTGSHTFTGLQNGQSYTITITARNNRGESVPAVVVAAAGTPVIIDRPDGGSSGSGGGSDSGSHTVQLGVWPPNSGTVRGSGTVASGDIHTVLAVPAAGYSFQSWTENGAVVSTDPSYSFTADWNRVLVANFTRNISDIPTPGGSILQPSSRFTYQSLTLPDAVVKVSGLFLPGTEVSAGANTMHRAGSCDACREMLAHQRAGHALVVYNITLSNEYRGNLEVSVYVGDEYNGEILSVLHCRNRTLEVKNLLVQDGYVTGTFSDLSPFAVLAPGTNLADTSVTTSGGLGEIGPSPIWLWQTILLAIAAIVTGLLIWRWRHPIED